MLGPVHDTGVGGAKKHSLSMLFFLTRSEPPEDPVSSFLGDLPLVTYEGLFSTSSF